MASYLDLLKQKNSIAYIVSAGAGLEAFIFREIEAFYERGTVVTIFATKFKKNDVFSPKSEWPCHTISYNKMALEFPIIFIKMCMRPRLFFEALKDGGLVDLVFATKFAPLIKKSSLRQIHCHFGDHKLFIGYYCKRITGLPLSVTIHAHEFYTNPNERLFRKALKECDCVFPIAKRWYEQLHKKYDIPQNRLKLNHLFVDIDIYEPKNVITVLSVGRFTERKGFNYLIDAAKLLNDIQVRFVFIGFGGVDVRAMAEKCCVRNKVVVFEKMDQEQLRHFYQTADILCVPSVTTEREGAEGIPVVLMEGMACGLPVVATRCGAIEEIVENFLVDERSPEQLAGAIRNLALDKTLRQSQGVRNREIVRERFSKANVEKFAIWLDELSCGKRGVLSVR